MPLRSSPDKPVDATPAGITLRTPDLSSRTALFILAVLVVLVGAFFYGRSTLMTEAFGDTDDATRMVMVRDLIDGQAWFDHGVTRLQPPLGLEMHWSRLVDGALAGLILTATPFFGATAAETWVRTAWPLFWLIPAAAAAFWIAIRLGGRRAVAPCAMLVLLSPAAFPQFAPGRVDHHDLQVVAMLAALSGAVWMDRRRGAGWLAGVATGLLVTVGLEALMFAALIGAAIALRLAADRSTAAGAWRYAAGLGLSAALGFLAQTDPSRWTAPACDALAINLLAALLVAATGLFVTARAVETDRLGGGGRVLALAATSLVAGAVYLALEPSCWRGPFANVDPRLYPIWLDLVKEVSPLATIWSSAPELALALAAAPVAALLAGGALIAATPARRDPAWLLTFAILVLAMALTIVQAPKGSSYAAWVAAPLAAAAVTLFMRQWRALLLPTLVLALALSPLGPLFAYHILAAPKPPEAEAAACNTAAEYAGLAQLPAGLVLADVDLGPMVLAFTHHSALAAPYHRMPEGIIAAHLMLDSRPDAARPLIRQRGIAYVVLCGPDVTAPFDAEAANLYRRLKSGDPVDWLEPVDSGSALRIFRVRP